MDIVLLGSGNVATHLGKGLKGAGHHIVQVYSRNKAYASALASLLKADTIDNITAIRQDADLYILAVTDEAIPPLAEELSPAITGIVVHCSGATPLAVLHHFSRYGVIYPPQSISKTVEADLSKIPFGIEGNDTSTSQYLLELMQKISSLSFLCSSQQRLALHIAAVFANNFSNALFQISHDILKQHELPFDLLKPIIAETAQKIQNNQPKDVQTGPAKRGDQQTIRKHLDFISENSNWVKIYQQLTEEITIQNR
ncbi:Rossmann-like and DUF2520 domain-containing protein [Sphingobacterium wenxiniae]|uniref:Predicted oxidoreductase, contains short-chain dehydrogenase (SDR) and DUF2520 domains n=1 Tax=Sphingobacterium wenxiniae TaxID=683125 RepID=A0A1I6VAU9_9SPHI|nr:Rossmann-like and DUF2520 domain-containing protein [Sphingobacterium wenxiniae]SFT10841.1 Predicted oxidoreductase, contains short-chain dehydrogenase (SDR) and DUF2520 domains [Sphingobacterium wenxiniae]